MKKINKNKKNKGFSLVEVLVAIAILALMSIPILKSFQTSAKINRLARRTENADVCASEVMENFKSLSLEQLKERYAGSYTESNGVYKFRIQDKNSRYYKGINGEEFEVEAVLDPAKYTDETDEFGNHKNEPSNNVNSFIIPKYPELSNKENFIIREETYKWDLEAVGTFKLQVEEFDESKVTKTLNISIDIRPEDTVNGVDEVTFIQTVKGSVTYEYNGLEYRKESYEFELNKNSINIQPKDNKYYVSNESGIKPIYMFYTPYSENANMLAGGMTNSYYTTDIINVDVFYDDTYESVVYKEADIYLVEQNIISADGKNIFLNRENINLRINDTKIDMRNYGTVGLSDMTGKDGCVSFYSNVKGFDEYKAKDNDKPNKITVNGSELTDYLYTITVNVRYEEELLVSVTSTKER